MLDFGGTAPADKKEYPSFGEYLPKGEWLQTSLSSFTVILTWPFQRALKYAPPAYETVDPIPVQPQTSILVAKWWWNLGLLFGPVSCSLCPLTVHQILGNSVILTAPGPGIEAKSDFVSFPHFPSKCITDDRKNLKQATILEKYLAWVLDYSSPNLPETVVQCIFETPPLS